MSQNINIGIYLQSYSVHKLYSGERRHLVSIDGPYKYYGEAITLFLVYDSEREQCQVVYEKSVEYKIDRETIRGDLFLLSVINELEVANSKPIGPSIINGVSDSFNGINIIVKKKDSPYFSSSRSPWSRNIQLFKEINKKLVQFSLVENDWVEYVYENKLYERFSRNLSTIFSQYIKDYLTKREELRKYDISEIVKDLSIELSEHFLTKVGGDDRYFVDEKRTISFPTSHLDEYLKEYIKLGDRTIHGDSGYTYARNMRIENLNVGIWNAEDTKPIKQKLIDEYSVDEHTASYFSKTINHYTNIAHIPFLHKNTDGITSYLMSSSFLSTLETIIGGGGYIREWDDIGEIISVANKKLRNLLWWKDT